MAKGYVEDESQSPMTSSTTTSTNTTVTLSIANTQPTSSTSTLPRNIGFIDNPPLELSKPETERNSIFVNPSQQNEASSANIPSAPPQTEAISSFNDTPFEMSAVTVLLREAKMAVHHSRSQDAEDKALSKSLNEIHSIVMANRSKLSQVQAEMINKEINHIRTSRRKRSRKKNFKHKHKRANPTGCLLILLILVMFFRTAFDIYSVFEISSSKIFMTSSICLLATNIVALFSTYLILGCYCCEYPARKFEMFFCILWTILYGIISTLVLAQSENLSKAAFCGYGSMISCILQGCLNICDYGNSKNRSRKHSCENKSTNMENNINLEIALTETFTSRNENDSSESANKKGCTSNANGFSGPSGSNQNKLTDSKTLSDPNINLDTRMKAIEILVDTIKSFLVEIHGLNYSEYERFDSSEGRNYENHQTENDGLPSKVMSQNVPNEAGISSNTPYYNNATYFDSYWFWCYNPSSAYNTSFPSCDCCNCDECCSGGDSNDCCGDGGDHGGDCCGDGGDCCGDGGDHGDDCCGDGGDCCGDCGDCNID